MPVWFWRAPGANQHVFAIESFLDEIVSAGGLDPYQVRRKLLEGKPDWLRVLDTAAEKSDWGKPLPKGRGRGIAICEDTDSLCAQVAEVTVRPNGDVKVDRVTVALDTRYMVNPLTIAEQAEGSVIFGLSAALYGKITVKDGVPVQGNFDTYRMVRLAEAPKIDVHLVPSGGKVWGGAGEPATPPIAAAVANAIFAATGKRIRTLPIIDNVCLTDQPEQNTPRRTMPPPLEPAYWSAASRAEAAAYHITGRLYDTYEASCRCAFRPGRGLGRGRTTERDAER
jgi:isoquinoline 1-oxidoreductase beta subunit